MKKHHTPLCPFIKKEQVKVDAANYFRVNPNKHFGKGTIEYNVSHETRNRIMERATVILIKNINSKNNDDYPAEMFKNAFTTWFTKLVRTDVRSYNGFRQTYEDTMVEEFKVALNDLLTRREFTLQKSKASGVLKAVDIVEVADDPCSAIAPIPAIEPSNDPVSLTFELKTGTAQIRFENMPTLEDIEMLTQYLKYKLS